MSASDSYNYELIDRLAAELTERYRCGERPSIQEFIERYPDQAQAIRELLPAMVQMEQAREEVGIDPAAGATPPSLERLGDFRILREIGHGGMGIVYEAEQESLGRRVALKILPKKMLLDAKQKRRFEREAKAAARLHHTNIVPVFGVFEHEGMPYYVMQYIQGQGLDQVLDELKRLQPAGSTIGFPSSEKPAADRPTKEAPAARMAHSLLTGEFVPGQNVDSGAPIESEPASSDPGSPARSSASFSLSGSSVALPGQSTNTRRGRRGNQNYWQSVAHIGVQVATALEYAHQQGIVHRDIKPSNLLLDTHAVVWVTDFGLAKADDQQNLTHTGDILGTLRYMPPEAFEGKTDARSDVYSLGLTLYEMLVLSPAYGERDKHRLIKRVTTEDAPRLERLNPSIPRDLVTIIHKAMDRESGARYATAGDLAADLQRFIDDEPILARRVSTSERLTRWARHNRGVAASLAVTALVVMIGLVLVTWKWQDERRARAAAGRALEKSELLAKENRLQLERLSAANDRLESGRNFLQDGAFAKARDEFSEAIRLHPDHSSAWNERGQLYCQLGLWDRAAPDVLRAFQLQPPSDRYRTRFRFALFCWQRGDVAGYREACNTMVRELDFRDRSDNAFWAVLAACLAPDSVEDPQLIVRAAQQHLQHYPRNATNLFQLGYAQYRAGLFSDALQSLKEAARLAGRENPMVEFLLAMTHFQRGEKEEAVQTLTHIAGLLRDRVWKADSRGLLKSHEGETWEGRAVIEELAGQAMDLIVKSRKHQALRHIVRARAFVELLEPAAAAVEFANAAAIEPANDRVRSECFRFYLSQQRWIDADRELEAIAATRPDDPQVFLEAFGAYADAGEWNRARAQHARAQQMKPTDPRIALAAFQYHAERAQWVEADQALKVQLERQTTPPALLHLECAAVYRELQQWAKAAAEYANVVERRPDDVWDSWYPYALLCLRAGNVDDYRRICSRLLDRFESTDNAALASRVAVICKLAPKAIPNTARLISFLRPRVKGIGGLFGHCLYRNGEFEAAVAVLLKSIPNIQDISHIWDKYFLAMAYLRLGKQREAERWLLEANQTVNDDKTFTTRVTRWDMRLDLELLREEAETLIHGAARRR